MAVSAGILAVLLFIVVEIAWCADESSVVIGLGEQGSGFDPNATSSKEEPSYEANWVITDQPRCCSDCTFVALGFKCKVKSCLHNCPWARSGGKLISYTSLLFITFILFIKYLSILYLIKEAPPLKEIKTQFFLIIYPSSTVCSGKRYLFSCDSYLFFHL
ncbi:hypothetical protein C0J52_06989 [Blattella germanica]|nr:hypothetical protein C0J52_06989 [Blattella germanica]